MRDAADDPAEMLQAFTAAPTTKIANFTCIFYEPPLALELTVTNMMDIGSFEAKVVDYVEVTPLPDWTPVLPRLEPRNYLKIV